jgi:MFS family permease
MTRSAPSSPRVHVSSEPAASSPARKPGVRALVRAVGGPRYVVALAVDSIGAGLQRPFLLLYGIGVLHLATLTAGLAMTAGVVAGLGCMPFFGRWLDRGARSAAVAASMLVRLIGTVLLLATPAGHVATVWMFAIAALFLGTGGQGVSAAHAALVSTISAGRQRDAALAAGRSVRNAGLGLGALLATASLTAGTAGLRALAAATAMSYLMSAALAYSVRVRASASPATARDSTPRDSTPRDAGPAPRTRRTAVPPMRLLLAVNVIYVFCLSIPEVALPLVLVTQLRASPVWAAAVFVINTGLVVTFQVPVTVWMSRFSRRTALAISGVVISVSYLGFLGSVELPHRWAVPAIVGVSVLSTLGELIYAGSATALVAATAPEHVLGRALARFQLSTGFSLAISPAIITALAARGPAALWVSLAAATLLAAAASNGRRHFNEGRHRPADPRD